MKGMKLPEPRESSLFNGEAGILLVAWRLAPSDELADDVALFAADCLEGRGRYPILE